MLVIGLTGGIGAGKSTVADLFTALNVPIIDADLIARELTKPGTAAFTAITTHFKENICHADGTLDRKKLRQIIFMDSQERLWLEQLLHPLINKEIMQRLQKLSAPYCIAVIPLLLEVHPYRFIDRILVVDTPEHIQLQRVAERDAVDKIHIEAILKTQITRQGRLAKADDVIINDGKLVDLEPQVEKLHKMYLELASML